MKRVFAVLLFFLMFSVIAGPKDYPPEFPEVFKELKMKEIDSKTIVPGVTYYRYYFEDFRQQTGDFYDVSYIVLKDNPKLDAKAELEAIRTRLLADKSLTLKAVADEKKIKVYRHEMLLPGSVMWFEVLENAVTKLKDAGDLTPVIPCDGGYFLIALDKKYDKNPLPEIYPKKFPVSLHFLVVDWENANVSVKLAESGMIHQTVESMIKKDKKTIGGTNGAYFHYKPFAKPYYPLKINGVLHEPPPGYDSKHGLMFDNGCFPVVDTLDKIGEYDNCIMGYYLMHDGHIYFSHGGSHWSRIFKTGTTPLTAIGYNRKTKRFAMVVGDGRFPKQAPGFSLYSICYFLRLVGCDEAITIDGGGSCQMLIKKGKKLELQNYPSDNGQFDHDGARRVHSCIYLIKGGKKDK